MSSARASFLALALFSAFVPLVLSACSRPSARSSTTVVTASVSAPQVVRLEVGGMTCQGCVARVQASLAAVPGVHRVDVSLDDQRAVVLADRAVADTALTGAVRRAGSEFLGIVVR